MKVKQVKNYMAILRNLRNILDKNVSPKHLEMVCESIRDPVAVAKSKQFPYRFVSAYKELEHEAKASKVLAALSDAVELSVQNIPEFSGKTFVTCDISGSMSSTPSARSKISMKEIGCLFGAIMQKKAADSVVSVFATDHVPISLNSRDSMFTNVRKMLMTDVHGYGTEAYKVMEWLNKNKVFVDRIVVFSDMQCYTTTDGSHFSTHENLYSGLIKYRQTVNKNVFVYSFDLSEYGEVQFPKDDGRVCQIGGWSDKVLSFIPMFERSRIDMLAEIESVTVS